MGVIHSLFFSFLNMNGDPQASGASAQNNGVGAPPPPLQEGRNWDRLFDMLMETLHVKIWFFNRLEADLDYLRTYSDKLKLVRLYKKFFVFMSYQVVSCLIYLYLVIMSSTYLRS